MGRSRLQPRFRLFYTPRWNALISALRDRDQRAVEAAVTFLEADPYFCFSGYEKERLYGHLSHVPLSESHGARLCAFVLRRCREKRYRHEFRKLRVLARAVCTPELM